MSSQSLPHRRTRPKAPELKDQTNLLPRGQLITVFCGLAFALLISFVDQNSIGVALPTIGRDLHALDTISWAGTSALIANTVCQVLYGRLSDIFGRKYVFLTALSLLAIGDLLCGFAKTSTQFYVFRGVAGVGNGGIGALTMMIVSDVVTLEDRGKYQGILGSCIGLGNAIGPFLSASFIERSTWRGLFWLLCPLAVLSGLVTGYILPSNPPGGNFLSKARNIDFYGLGLSSIGIVFLLIPISGGGAYFAWNSPMVIAMLCIGGVSSLLFLVVEWKASKLPMLPLRLFRIVPISTILTQNFLFGIVYYSDLYYLPIYYQNVRGWNAIVAAALTIPLVIGQSVTSVLTGLYISKSKHYGGVVWTGYFLWTLGAGLKCLFNRKTHPAVIVFILVLEGCGVGGVFQPTLVAAQAHSPKADRAVVISVRNFMRSLGGACGLALSAAILSNVFRKSLPGDLPLNIADTIRSSTYSVPDLSSLSDVQHEQVLDAYMAASRAVFVLFVPLIGVCLMGCVFIKDKGLQRAEEKMESGQGEDTGTGEKDVGLPLNDIPSTLPK